MPIDKVDELASNIDDAKIVADDLETGPDSAASEKIDELKKTLERTSDIIDDMAETKEPK